MLHQRVLSFDDIYRKPDGPIFMTGIQALVRLPMMQRRLDRAAGLNTAGLVSGYRGSPLGAYDQQLWKAAKLLEAEDVVFQPGLNEDLAATALWGAQMHRAFGEVKADGVFGIWYGKGAGVDRTGDVFRNANVLGTSPLGGVLAVAGDDHAAQSSMFPHQTDGIFQSVNMPVLQPADVREILTLGLAGIALSRFSGLWIGMKTIAEVVESAASFDLPEAPSFVTPSLPGTARRNWDPTIQWPAQRAELERRLVEERLPAVLAWARANRLDRPALVSPDKRLCIVTLGKAHGDVMQALADLGVAPGDLGISVYKVAMSWPLDTQSLLAFADGFEQVLVVEEKKPVVEDQIKVAAYGRGLKLPIRGKDLLPEVGEFSAAMVARALAQVLPGLGTRLPAPRNAALPGFAARKPYFCAGCPHNSSTKTPDGSITGGGIGCHVMALSQPALKTTTFSQMGGEGMQWAGAAPFSKTGHIFQNLGDGTYQHSGLLAIRGAIAAGTNITFKILYNDAVAMTGGQPAEGTIDPARITRQLAAEGVNEIWFVSDAPEKWRTAALAPGTELRHRDELDAVQRHLRTVPGVTALVYEQTCAAEKRRRRKRGTLPEPDKRLFINPRVCEGCGDCSVQSNCVAVEPLETEFGRKRRINQSACNKDFSCVAGFCPSFVEIEGAVLRKPDPSRAAEAEARLFASLAEPAIAPPTGDYNIYVAGIGGLGVLTIGALLGAAAHIDGLGATVLDFTGLAQKNGAVVSQVRIAPHAAQIHAVRIGDGRADLLLGTDLVVSAAADALVRLDPARSAAVLNSDVQPTADFVRDRDTAIPAPDMADAIAARARALSRLPATAIAEGLFGNSTAANVLLAGFAWQSGLIPLTRDALRAAIEANGAAVAMNLRAFEWGRLAAVDRAAVDQVAGLAAPAPIDEGIEALVARRVADLTAYQDAGYARRYQALVEQVRQAASPHGASGEALVRAVAANAYKLMAYKDEYEVARLYSAPEFAAELTRQFAGTGKTRLHLAPPLLSRLDPATGRPRKRAFGPWIFPALRLLAHGKRLRGGWADPFARTEERRRERALIAEYFADIERALRTLDPAGLERACALAALPDDIRGFGPVKAAAFERHAARRAALLAEPQITQ
ncbi:indolepyruvate ferredoxin oxidoreductase family protein [Sphingomonas sp. HITSZ_GF]|uniref:indolepyruvate ferredoxin oxidoreductase family protein n=1 Tax=Sphingomonas sp. HITSZ_GF TaxID=3037247 RepID=UPI00240E16A6|nr:indolepyruvate ferredoxin oxidoreductase family protein [Sphingomonas sp. HITSZ_GF]MDG2534419.1 indolepyruvate ferredoxin oxidoreductase family protein [Sphingomonas sp. HITSZ_GF]